MSRSARLALSLTALLMLAAPAWAQGKKDMVRNYGIGHVATPEQIAGWASMCVRTAKALLRATAR